MRKLLIVRGPQGAGKSSFITQMGLDNFVISPDRIRQTLAGPVLNPQGHWQISQAHNARVFAMAREIMAERMMRGELLAIDQTAPRWGDLSDALELAHKWRYEVLTVNFSSMPLARIMAQNDNRPALKRVSGPVLERTWTAATQALGEPNPAGVEQVVWSEDGAHAKAVRSFLDTPVVDLSRYRRIIHVGDLQGCFSPLAGPGGLFESGLADEDFHVFVGDLIDRGPENGQVLQWFLNHACDRDNVCLLHGNHEDHLHRHARGMAPISREFEMNTLPQMTAAGITRDQSERICAFAREALVYQYRDQHVLVTHAGLPTMPQRLAEVSLHQLSHGTGNWSDPIDAQFERQAPAPWVQVHGHRNHGLQPVRANARSFNLEDRVEAGGHLRAVILDSHGWHPLQVRNRHVRPSRERIFGGGRKPVVVPAWMTRPEDTQLPPELREQMQAHHGVRVRSSQSYRHLVSYNFTKQVFFDQSWDDIVVRARGLFVDQDTGQIAARSYDKFFNLDERPETKHDALEANLVWPVQAFVKENGYLGIVGIDPRSQDLFLTSKSTPDSEFAQWFQEIFEQAFSEGQRERIRRWLVDNEASMAFEVIDPVRDPHMIEYDQASVVLLDVFHRAAHCEKLPYDDLAKLGQHLGLPVKQRGMSFSNMAALSGWLRSVTRDLSARPGGRDIEGYVLEDAQGFQTKIKLPHYAFWKRMRSAKDRLARLMSQAERAARQAETAMTADGHTGEPSFEQWRNAFVARRPQRAANMDAAALMKSFEADRQARSRRKTAGAQSSDQLRGERDRLIARDTHPLARAFLAWADTQDADALAGQSIIALRRAFDQDVGIKDEWLTTPWGAFAPDEKAKSPAQPNRIGMRAKTR